MNDKLFYCHVNSVYVDQISTQLKIALSKYGNKSKGLGIYLFLRLKIADEFGYFMPTHEDALLLFSDSINESFNTVTEIIKIFVNYGIFDKEKYEKYNILTSLECQKNWYQVAKRKKEAEYNDKYLLNSFKQYVSKCVENANKNGKNANKKSIFVEQTKQNNNENVNKFVKKIVNKKEETEKNEELVNKIKTIKQDFFNQGGQIHYNIGEHSKGYDIIFEELAKSTFLDKEINISGAVRDKYDIIDAILKLTPEDYSKMLYTISEKEDIDDLQYYLLGMIFNITKNRKFITSTKKEQDYD